MGPYTYRVDRIEGEYAYLVRTDLDDPGEPLFIAMALLPEGTDVGSDLRWEAMEYTLL